MFRLLLLSLTFTLSLLIFQSGFLLKRHELHFKSKCADFHKFSSSNCWMPQQYKKIVVLLVDALRHDFLRPLGKAEPKNNFRGHMPGVEKLLREGGAAAGTILADPPTTTLQRIKGLTTGTLPTFIDSADNFSPNATVNEDNFIFQAQSLNKSILFFGDDTWFSLYPSLDSSKSQGYPSFDVNDLDTVDDAVRLHLESHFKDSQKEEEVDLIVAHLLGVDHCGHKFGPTHSMMATILRRTDQLIYKTALALKEEELLIVLGDHGMTATGDHGGDSDDETHAGVFMYTPGRQLSLPSRPLSQIDLVPTISLLLGVPIPFSNLGVVIRSLFPESKQNLAVELNYEQISRFANTYATTYSFSELLEMTTRDAITTEDRLWIMERVQDILREAWTRFDWPRMRTGLLSLLEASLFMFSGRVIDIPELIVRSGCFLLQFSIWLSDSEDMSLAFSLLTGVLLLSLVYSVGCCLFLAAASSFSRRSLLQLVSIMAVFLHSVSFTSNSYVVYEGHSLRYLLQGITAVAGYQQLKNFNRMKEKTKPLTGFLTSREGMLFIAAMAILRSEPLFHRCREEELACDTSFFAQMLGAISSDARFWRLAVSWTSMAVFYTVARRQSPPKNGKNEVLQLIWPFSRLVFFLIAGHQLVQVAVVSTLATVTSLQAAAMSLAIAVYLCTLVAVSLAFVYRRTASPLEVQRYVGFALSWSLLLVLGDGLVLPFLAFCLLLAALADLCSSEDRDALPWIVSLLLPFGFYLTGHSPTIPAIPWTAGFVGIPGNFWFKSVPGLLIGSHLFCSTVAAVLLLSLLSSSNSSSASFPFSSLIATSSWRAFFVSLAALLHRRHLMVWKIFAPHFIFETVSFLVLTSLVVIRQLLTLLPSS